MTAKKVALVCNFRVKQTKQVLQKCRERQITTHYLFITIFQAAYDTTDRNELCDIMQRYHFPGKLIRLLEATTNGMEYKVSFEARG